MFDWRDLNHNGEIEPFEEMEADEALCTSREEHIALFGNPGNFDDDDDFDYNLDDCFDDYFDSNSDDDYFDDCFDGDC